MNIQQKRPAGIKYVLVKENLPAGATDVHYIIPIEVNGNKTQVIPVTELENNPAKYASMFPQYIKKVENTTPLTVRTTAPGYQYKNGALVKTPKRRTVADIAVGATVTTPATRSVTPPKVEVTPPKVETETGQLNIQSATTEETAKTTKRKGS